jgi:Fibronectin type III domain
MPLSFPSSPTNGDTYTVGTRTWTWNGSIWELNSSALGVASVTESELASNSVTTSKIASNAVTTAKIAANAVTTAKIDSAVNILTVCTSTTRPSTPSSGKPIFETDTNAFLIWDGSTWLPVGLRPPSAPTSLSAVASTTSVAISFTAGSSPISAISNYEYRISTNGGSTYGSWTALSPADSTSPITVSGLSMGTSYVVQLRGVNEVGSGVASSGVSFTTTTEIAVEYLVIAGGGNGGYSRSGGGGAGGYRTNVSGATSGGGASAEAAMNLSPGTYTVTVGGGGGNASAFHTISCVGGGYGASENSDASLANGGSGGSGGGACTSAFGVTGTGGAGTANQGYAGGSGGGGKGGGGAGGTTSTGTGGVGVSSSITGTAVTRAVGGNGYGGGGGSAAGAANTGNGGGGADPNTWGGAGGSGVVIVRYLTSSATGLTITGGTATTSGSYTVRTFNSSGSLVIS